MPKKPKTKYKIISINLFNSSLKPENLNKKVNENIAGIVAYISDKNGVLNDTITFSQPEFLQKWYTGRDSLRTWSTKKQWTSVADSLFGFIKNSEKLLKRSEGYFEIWRNDSCWW